MVARLRAPTHHIISESRTVRPSFLRNSFLDESEVVNHLAGGRTALYYYLKSNDSKFVKVRACVRARQVGHHRSGVCVAFVHLAMVVTGNQDVT